MKKFFVILLRVLLSVLLSVLLVFVLSSVTAVYRFRPPVPFSGPDIFNPYRDLDTTLHWKKANFHTHTRVKGPFPPNECPVSARDTYDSLRRFGYDIITFSNHNELTPHPVDSALQVNVYEHGMSLFKFHKLVFGSEKIHYFDHLLPLFASQKQFQLDFLGKDSDFIQLNHPYRTIGTCPRHFRALSGYEIMELDTGVSTENEYWDWALSAGHYSFGLANDDLHYPDKAWKIARRFNFLCCPSERYEDIRRTLLSGAYYAMRAPNFGSGDWKVKHEKISRLPALRTIGLAGDTLYCTLSVAADSIKVFGQDHTTLAAACGVESFRYRIRPEDPYARLTVYFPEGVVAYSNPFARYDASLADGPQDNRPQEVSIFLTILFNLAVLSLSALLVWLIVKLWTGRRRGM